MTWIFASCPSSTLAKVSSKLLRCHLMPLFKFLCNWLITEWVFNVILLFYLFAIITGIFIVKVAHLFSFIIRTKATLFWHTKHQWRGCIVKDGPRRCARAPMRALLLFVLWRTHTQQWVPHLIAIYHSIIL